MRVAKGVRKDASGAESVGGCGVDELCYFDTVLLRRPTTFRLVPHADLIDFLET